MKRLFGILVMVGVFGCANNVEQDIEGIQLHPSATLVRQAKDDGISFSWTDSLGQGERFHPYPSFRRVIARKYFSGDSGTGGFTLRDAAPDQHSAYPAPVYLHITSNNFYITAHGIEETLFPVRPEKACFHGISPSLLAW